jgi:hypothetical protein
MENVLRKRLRVRWRAHLIDLLVYKQTTKGLRFVRQRMPVTSIADAKEWHVQHLSMICMTLNDLEP